jgi:hypothetical protein
MRPTIRLPRAWNRRAKSAILYILALSHCAFTAMLALSTTIRRRFWGLVSLDQYRLPRWDASMCKPLSSKKQDICGLPSIHSASPQGAPRNRVRAGPTQNGGLKAAMRPHRGPALSPASC